MIGEIGITFPNVFLLICYLSCAKMSKMFIISNNHPFKSPAKFEFLIILQCLQDIEEFLRGHDSRNDREVLGVAGHKKRVLP